jgi:hypothetical protein
MMENRHQGLADRPGHPGMDGGPEQENRPRPGTQPGSTATRRTEQESEQESMQYV